MNSSFNQVLQKAIRNLGVLFEHRERQASCCSSFGNFRQKLFFRKDRGKYLPMDRREDMPFCSRCALKRRKLEKAKREFSFENLDALFSAALVEGSEVSDVVTFFIPLNELVKFVN